MNSTSNYLSPEQVKTIAVIGTGSVGASWTALFLARGFEVVAQNPAPAAEHMARDFVTAAWPALRSLGMTQAEAPPLDRLRFVATAAEAACVADLVQENVPERPDVKAKVIAELDRAAAPHKIIVSSTGGITPTRLQAACVHPERLVVLHPFNPTHIVPLVEVVAGEKTAPEVTRWAFDFARYIGKHPIVLKTDTTGHMANRLQFALLREAVHCLVQGIASAEDIDAAVRYALGPRWTLMGSLMTLHMAGGPGGMRGILDHAGDAIEGWWDALGNPRLTRAVKERLIEAATEISHGRSIDEWTRWRDASLTDLIKLQRDSETAMLHPETARASADRQLPQGETS